MPFNHISAITEELYFGRWDVEIMAKVSTPSRIWKCGHASVLSHAFNYRIRFSRSVCRMRNSFGRLSGFSWESDRRRHFLWAGSLARILVKPTRALENPQPRSSFRLGRSETSGSLPSPLAPHP